MTALRLALHLTPDAVEARLGDASARIDALAPAADLHRWPAPWRQTDPLHLLRAVEGVLTAAALEGPPLAAIEVHVTGRTLLAVGRENVPRTALAWAPEGAEAPPPPALLPAALAAGVSRYATAGAWVVRWLTREWIDVRGHAPLGLPLDPATQDYPRDPAAFRALGVRLTACPLLAPPGAVLAQLAPEVAARLGLPPFTPLLAP